MTECLERLGVGNTNAPAAKASRLVLGLDDLPFILPNYSAEYDH